MFQACAAQPRAAQAVPVRAGHSHLLRSAGLCRRRRQLLVLPHAAEGSVITLAELEEAVNSKNGKNGHDAEAAAAAYVASAAASDGVAAGPAPADDAWQGTWAKAWYAVAPAASIDGSRPTPFTLLGKDLVIWKEGDSWACLDDRCPHRSVPLSEGKVWEDGSLMCSYHGWRFDNEGTCNTIPQASSDAAEATAAANKRACAVPYPITEAQGMLFVWGEGGAAAMEESRLAAPQTCKLTERTEAAGGSMMTLIKPYTRDLPYSYQGLLENIVDPAHVPFSHHGVMGSREKQLHGMWDLRRAGSLAVDWAGGFGGEVKISYHPPGLVTYHTKNKRGGLSTMMFWITPIAPGRSRITLKLDTDTPPKLPLRLLFQLPAWVDHVRTRSKVFDGDNVFLQGQDRLLAEHTTADGPAAWRKLFYLATSADTLVAGVRDWMDSQAGGGPFGSPQDASSAEAAAAAAAAAAKLAAPIVTGEASRRQLLDRYHQHTVHCHSCMQALRVTTAIRAVAAGVAVVAAAAASLQLFGLAAAGASLASRALSAAWPTALAALAAFVAVKIDRLRSAFLFTDWEHATN